MNCLLLCIAAVTAGLVSASAQQDKPWRIGALYPLTGNLAVLGNENLVGARFAVEMINETGDVDRRPVELVT